MKRRFTLAQKLTGSIAAAVLLGIAVVVVTFIVHFKPQLTQNTEKMILRGTTSSAYMYLYRWQYDFRRLIRGVNDKKSSRALMKKFQKELDEHPEIAAIGLFRVSSPRAAGAAGKAAGRFVFDELALTARMPIVDDARYTGITDFSTATRYVSGENSYAAIPIRDGTQVIGLMLFSEHTPAYTAAGRRISRGLLSMTLLFFVFLLAFVFWLGSRTGKPLEWLAETAAQISSGDLTKKVKVSNTTVAEIARLGTAIEDMAQALREQVTTVKSLTQQAALVSKSVASAMSHLAGAASEQAAAVAETAITVEEMERIGKSVATSVRRIVEAAEGSARASERGRQAINTANAIIVKIRTDAGNISSGSLDLLSHVEEVGNVIKSVNAISEQSQILAVNASIEAAKAGEYGAGFAVVASEVKHLAGQSREATEQITRTLMAIRKSVQNMVQLSRDGEERTSKGVLSIEHTGTIVNDLGDAIQEASLMANEINSSVTRQSAGLSQIAAAMEEINTSAMETRGISIDIESDTTRMSASLGELHVLVDIWRTIDQAETGT